LGEGFNKERERERERKRLASNTWNPTSLSLSLLNERLKE